MAAAKAPLEFHAKRPWAGQEAVGDPDEEDEDDSGEAENGFSLEEVLRLGGTKVTAGGFQGRETGAGVGVVLRVSGQWSAAPAPRTQIPAVECALCASLTSFPCSLQEKKSGLNVLCCGLL